MTPIKHASVAWRRVVARSHSARRLPPPEHVCLSQSKRWRGGTRPTAACACTVVCVCVCVRRRSWAGLWAVMERRTWHSLAVCVGRPRRDFPRAPRSNLACCGLLAIYAQDSPLVYNVWKGKIARIFHPAKLLWTLVPALAVAHGKQRRGGGRQAEEASQISASPGPKRARRRPAGCQGGGDRSGGGGGQAVWWQASKGTQGREAGPRGLRRQPSLRGDGGAT